MIITKHTVKRITSKVNDLAKAEPNTDKLVKELKSYVLQAVVTKGIPINIAEEVAARLILLISILNPPTIK